MLDEFKNKKIGDIHYTLAVYAKAVALLVEDIPFVNRRQYTEQVLQRLQQSPLTAEEHDGIFNNRNDTNVIPISPGFYVVVDKDNIARILGVIYWIGDEYHTPFDQWSEGRRGVATYTNDLFNCNVLSREGDSIWQENSVVNYSATLRAAAGGVFELFKVRSTQPKFNRKYGNYLQK